MSAKSMIRLVILPLAIACAAPVFAADDPSAHQIYLAAQAGKFEEAQAMMDKVLRDHPNSGKAHFIQAELLAKQGRMLEADAELAKAERFAPGLSFAKPEAVKNLKAMIARASAATTPGTPALSSPAPLVNNPPAYANREAPAAPASSIPWGMLLILAAVVAIVIGAIRAMRRKAAQPFAPAGAGGYGPAPAGQPYQPYGGGPAGPTMGTPGSGIGSNIMGGLATGAAVGAGIVAGEALMHRFTDRDRDAGSNSNHVNYDAPAPAAVPDQSLLDDMGGTDFGVSDGGSWDGGGGGGGGGDEWN